MQALICPYWAPKAGNTADEFEDAFWPGRGGRYGGESLRCAVADGATETSFAALWARLLVSGFGRRRLPPHRLRDALLPLQAKWRAETTTRPLPWYAEEKLRSGAFSSLLGVTLSAAAGTDRTVWRAWTVGDSCLLIVRDGEVRTAFPLQSAAEFTSRPHLLSSLPGGNSGLERVVAWAGGECAPGDVLYLLTDALACWFLACHESGGAPWHVLDDARRSFGGWVESERAAARLRNDDVTMVRVQVE